MRVRERFTDPLLDISSYANMSVFADKYGRYEAKIRYNGATRIIVMIYGSVAPGCIVDIIALKGSHPVSYIHNIHDECSSFIELDALLSKLSANLAVAYILASETGILNMTANEITVRR